jgi:hypothetical protein
VTGDDSTNGTERIKISEQQRERFDAIRESCQTDHIPAPSDQQMFGSLLDTWDAVDDGLYTDADQAPESNGDSSHE